MQDMISGTEPTTHGRIRERAKGRAGRRRWRGLGRLPDRRVRAECGCRHPYGELGDGAAEVRLDVRGMPMDGQIGRTLEVMEELPPGSTLRHVNSIVPWPLFAMLETRGYRYRLVANRGGDVQVLVWRLEPAQGRKDS